MRGSLQMLGRSSPSAARRRFVWPTDRQRSLPSGCTSVGYGDLWELGPQRCGARPPRPVAPRPAGRPGSSRARTHTHTQPPVPALPAPNLRLQKDGATLEPNEFGWNRNNGLLVLDQPLGTGYSDVPSEPVDTEDQVAADVYAALQGFFHRHQRLRKRPFFIAGESFAGAEGWGATGARAGGRTDVHFIWREDSFLTVFFPRLRR